MTQTAGKYYYIPSDQGVIDNVGDFMDHLSKAASEGSTIMVLPATVLAPSFFDMDTGIAGDILQKLQTKGMRGAVAGDIQQELNQSRAFQDFVEECNKGDRLQFVSSIDEISFR